MSRIIFISISVYLWMCVSLKTTHIILVMQTIIFDGQYVMVMSCCFREKSLSENVDILATRFVIAKTASAH